MRLKLAKLLIAALLLTLLIPMGARAASVSVAAYTGQSWRYGGTTAKLRIYPDTPFLAADGTFIQRGDRQNKHWYIEVACTVYGSTVTIGSVAGFGSETD